METFFKGLSFEEKFIIKMMMSNNGCVIKNNVISIDRQKANNRIQDNTFNIVTN